MATPGSLLPGGFVLGRLSHADRVGLVYRAHHAENKSARPASALVLHPLHVEELRDWFEKMSVLGRSLRHPNLVDVYALGYTSNELPVVVTEWVEGKTVRNELASARVFAPSEVARIVQEVSSALDYLHRRTPMVLHRVIMPETVLLSAPSGTVKLLAVGHADRPHHPSSRSSYLSPEELSSEGELSPVSDVFSLASLAYELLTGTVAFTGNAHTILAAIYRSAHPRIGASEGAGDVERVLQRAWSSDPSRRHSSAGAFADALGSALENLSGVVSGGRRSIPPGAMRAPTFPSAGSGAGVATSTGRFASATFHADALSTQRPFAPVAQGQLPNIASRWTPAVGLSSSSPLVVQQGVQALASVARVETPAAARAHSISRTSGVQRSVGSAGESDTPGGPRGSETEVLALDDVTVPGRKENARNPIAANDVVPPGALDDSLRLAPRLVDDDLTAPSPPSPRKNPLFSAEVRRPATPVVSSSRLADPPSAESFQRHSGEFPPAVPPAARRGASDVGVVPVLLTVPRAPSKERSPPPVPATEKVAQATELPTTRYQVSTESALPLLPESVPPAAANAQPAAAKSTRPVVDAKRSPFERDAFEPAPEEAPRDDSRKSTEVRFTWPVVLGLVTGHATLTALLVFGLGQLLPSRTPAVVYVAPPEVRASGADIVAPAPSREPAPAPAAQTVPIIIGPSTPPSLGNMALPPLEIEPLAPAEATAPDAAVSSTPAVVAPAVVAPAAPVVLAPSAPVVVAPAAPVVAAPAATRVRRRREVWSPLETTPVQNTEQAPVLAPAPPVTAPPVTAPAPPVTAPPVTAPAPPVTAPAPRAPSSASGFGEPPPNPY